MNQPAGPLADEQPDSEESSYRYFQPWDHRLCFELALNLHPLPEILQRYNITSDELSHLLKQSAFKEQVAGYKREIKEKGLSFREKARIMAEDLLGTAYDIIHHPGSAPSTKADLIKWVAKVADLEPRQSAQETSNPLLPAIAEHIRRLPDGDLEVQVMRIVQRKKEETPSPTQHPYEPIIIDHE